MAMVRNLSSILIFLRCGFSESEPDHCLKFPPPRLAGFLRRFLFLSILAFRAGVSQPVYGARSGSRSWRRVILRGHARSPV